MDSFIESLSGGVLIWRFKTPIKDEHHEQRIEKRTLQLVAYSFFIFSLYVSYEALKRLYEQEKPEATLLGILIVILSILIMPILTWQKYQTGRALTCALLSVILLVGLALNYFLGYWWADPLASLGIVVFMAKEGVELFKHS